MSFEVEAHPIITLKPRLADPLSWAGHIPFAYLLVDLARPRLVVELGTHSGNSYLAICQAVQHLDLPTQCVAVDSWEGDEHADVYGEQIYRTLKAYHDPLYGQFSKLVRAYFDDAVGEFEDASIDLLHIDGLHTYEAVRNDFETWLPKLSERAVVIFHDTAVHERGFGVDAYFSELENRYPGFRFNHSNGLGVLLVGAAPPAALVGFLEAFDRRGEKLKNFFAALGDRIVDRQQVESTQDAVSFQLYFRAHSEDYIEGRMLEYGHEVGEGLAALDFVFPIGSTIDCVRLDPADVPGCFGLVSIDFLDGNGAALEERVELSANIVAVNGTPLPPREPSWYRWVEFGCDPFVEIDISSLACVRDGLARGMRVTLDYEVTASSSPAMKLAKVFQNGIVNAPVQPAALRELCGAIRQESALTRASIDSSAVHARNLQAEIERMARDGGERRQEAASEVLQLSEALRTQGEEMKALLNSVALEQRAIHNGMRRRSPVWWMRRLLGGSRRDHD